MNNVESDVMAHAELARQHVYELFPPTPLESAHLFDGRVFFKREDLSPVHSFKWRGAFAALKAAQLDAGATVVTASAGNHAQGVAASVRHLGLNAVVFMPERTPDVKIEAVRDLGGEAVRVELTGSNYDEAHAFARTYAARNSLFFLHPFDHTAVMGGNATIAQEVVKDLRGQKLDVAYLQIGGGGLAAGVALWLRRMFPEVHLVGVEAQGQASMGAALRAAKPVSLASVDTFCDGTAVKQAGAQTFELCRNLFNEMVTVSNDEVREAMEELWTLKRLVAEPSGALGFAGFLTQRYHHRGCNVLTVISGANMDFQTLSRLSPYREEARAYV